MTPLTIIFLIFAGIFFVSLVSSPFVDAIDDRYTTIPCLIAAISFVISIFVLIIAACTNDGVTEYEFPKEEYKLEYRITTQGEVSDTTYIISKIPD